MILASKFLLHQPLNRQSEAYAREIPGASFAIIADAGHYPHVECPDVTASRISAFVEASTRRPLEISVGR